PLPADPDALSGRQRQLLSDRRRPADARRHRPQLGHVTGCAGARAGRARAADRGPRAHRPDPSAHGPPRSRLDPRAPLGRTGRGAGPARPVGRALRREHGRRRCLRRARDGRARHPRGRAPGPACDVARLSRARRLIRRHAAARRRLRARVRRPHAARPPPPGPLALGHDLPRRAARNPDRGGPSDQAHLLQPADLAAAGRAARRRSARPPARAGDLPRLDARDAGDGTRRLRPGRARRSGRRPRRADRLPLQDAPPARAQDPPAGRGRAADGLRDRRRALGDGRGDTGLPDAVGGARPLGPARRRRAGRRGALRRRRRAAARDRLRRPRARRPRRACGPRSRRRCRAS
ncbi:MAG: hypothetical protein QOE11_244, partial [Solirubrobacteraceae bacterium]|nr:hypothetical protein [Solirubrobacteraceae bacterium]